MICNKTGTAFPPDPKMHLIVNSEQKGVNKYALELDLLTHKALLHGCIRWSFNIHLHLSPTATLPLLCLHLYFS